MTIGRIRERLAELRPDATAGRWWHAALWVPVGYASTRVFGDTLPVYAIGGLVGTVALVHWVVPAGVEVAAGAGALVVGANHAADGSCHLAVGHNGVVVLMVFAGAVLVSVVIRLLGSDSVHEASRNLLLGAVALELALAAARPLGQTSTALRGTTGTAVALGGLLVAFSLVGIKTPFGPPLLGTALVGVEGALALTGGPCHTVATHSLVGILVFTAVAVFLETRPLPFGYDEGDARGEEHWATDYADHGPVREVRVQELRVRQFRVIELDEGRQLAQSRPELPPSSLPEDEGL